MRKKLLRDSLKNEAVESWSFRVRFSGEGTLYVQIPGEWHIRVERKVHPGHLNLLCVVKIVFGDLGKQYKLPTPLKRHMSGLALQGLCFVYQNGSFVFEYNIMYSKRLQRTQFKKTG